MLSKSIEIKEIVALSRTLLALRENVQNSRVDAAVDNKILCDTWERQHSHSPPVLLALKELFLDDSGTYNPFQCYVHSGSLSTFIFRRSLSTCYVTRPACPHTEMVKTLSEDLRWRVIYHRNIYGSSIEDTARSLIVSKRFVSNVRALYERTKDVKTARRRGRLRVLSCE